MKKINKKEFYKELMGEKWFKREILTAILEDIGAVQEGNDFDMDGEVEVDRDGIQVREEYNTRSCGCCYEPAYETRYIYWDYLVDKFFEELEKEDG